MQKKILSVILVIFMFIGTVQWVYGDNSKFAESASVDTAILSSYDETFVSGDYEYYINFEDTAVISDYTGTATELTIPEALDGYTVTEIGNSAFEYNQSLTSVTIPNTVTKIGIMAFAKCYNLTDVKLSENLIYISYEAFYECAHLKTINIPSKVSQIAGSAFEETILESVTIPNSVLLIGHSAFDVLDSGWFIDGIEYTGLKNVYYNGTEEQWNNLKVISGNDDLYSAKIQFNNNIAYSGSCGDNATWRIEDKTLIISGTGAIDDYCYFDKGWGYPEWLAYDYDTIRIEEGITSIGMCALDETIVAMSGNWFYEFGNLTAEEIAKLGLYETNSGDVRFNIDRVEKIIFPKSLEKIEMEALYKCNKLTDVYYTGTEKEWNKISIGSSNNALESATIHYNSDGLPNINNVSVTKKNNSVTVNVSVSDVMEPCTMLVALYNSKGALVGFKEIEVNAGDTEKTVTVTAENAKNAKVFLWDDLQNLKPLCESVQKNIK